VRILACVLAAIPEMAFAQVARTPQNERPAFIALTFPSSGSVTFRLEQQRVTRVDVRLRGVEFSVPFECAGGLRNVRVETSELILRDVPTVEPGSAALLFEMGQDDERKFGRLPRVQINLSGGKVTDMLVTTATAENASLSSNLCSSLPPDSVCAPNAPRPRVPDAAAIVQQLRDLPTPLPAGGNAAVSAVERRRRELYEQLRVANTDGVRALARGLEDPDVRLRRNVTVALMAVGGGWWPFECGPSKVDITAALPALGVALRDSDPSVRGWAAQAIGGMGADAVPAVPALIELLSSDDVGSRNSACIALRAIGPPARDALPALRQALSDPNSNVRRFAQQAIESIGG
jgi:HEAT repeat protein